MHTKIFFYWVILSMVMLHVSAQTLQILTGDTKTSLRGLCVVDDQIIWASGNNGTVLKSTDGGNSWQSLTVNGYETRDFRDVEAFDSHTALIMAVAEPAVILKTTDGGSHWIKVFEDSTKGMFLDAMGFADEQTGVVIGDPVNSKVFMAMTFDQGGSWMDPVQGDTSLLPSMFAGEAFFASSGTNICLKSNENHELTGAFVSGGAKSRFFTKTSVCDLPMRQGKESTGANSVSISKTAAIVVVGGDFKQDKDTAGNCLLSRDDGRTWYRPQTAPHGYRSCVIYINDRQLITCGTSGVDFSHDGGQNWQLISPESFHVVQKAKNGTTVFLAGSKGKIARLEYSK